MAGQTVDFNAIAKQFGGVSAPPANAPSGPVDYAAIAKQNGATAYRPPQSGAEGLKSEGFLESAWKMLTSPVRGAVEMFTPHSRAEKEAQIQKALNWADRFVAAHQNGTDAEKKAVNDEGMVALPFGSTVYKAKEGNYTGAAGDLAGMVALGGLAKAADNPIVQGGVKGAAKAAVETQPVTFKGLTLPVPTVGASAVGGGAASGWMGLGHTPGMIAGAAAPIIRGAVRGAKAAIAERKLAAEASKIPPDVMAELTRESGVPEATPPQAAPMEAPQGQPIPTPRPRSENLDALARLQADQASRAATGPVPVEPQKLIGPGPANVLQMPAAQDGSFVRAVPAEYPRKLTPGQPIPPDMTRPESDAALAQQQAAVPDSGELPGNLPGNLPPQIDPQPSPVHANGETKSAAFRGEEKRAGNTAAKAERIAQKMHESGVTAEMAEQIQAGMISDTQIRDGMPPRWGNVAQQLGETEPGSSVPGIIAKLRDLEAEAARKTGPMSNPKARAAAQALADAMAEDEPKAAAAAKGK